MTVNYEYHKIVKYLVKAECTEPLHIGGTAGEPGDILIHPADDMPFIQASGISGVFRDYYRHANSEKAADELFGAGKQDDREDQVDRGSRLRFTDGTFLTKDSGIKLERRPRVAIDPVSGTAASSIVMGTDRSSGHKFDTEYIGAGAKFSFCVYLYDDSCQEALEDVFAAANAENLQFGGQKSSGCGHIRVISLKCRVFDMTREADRKLWMQEEELDEREYQERLHTLKAESRMMNAYDIRVTGYTEGSMLIKSAAVTDYGIDAPDSMNIRNAEKDYIIPGSSLKGALRSQMEKIVSYLECSGVHMDGVINEAFGTSGSKQGEGMGGNLKFYDTIVGNRKENDMAPLERRIHIDKFTGGVMHGGLFSEKNVSGRVDLRISVLDKNEPDRVCGILLMALRDLSIGAMNLGSGYSIGKGMLRVEKISIAGHHGGNRSAVIHMREGIVEDPEGVIPKCLASIRGEEG